ncbi:nitrous oxide reductase family maturation protein NosD [Sulfurirhabdus autotrophica]|uniref:nitrous oxide reductase family maturation protein NosD n=1 Tax=Sulfurirhabdus autotrophica TaxID=1706046 RepID=UPI001CB92B67|nr:nitrous oxide reductase family maturation protein NosD [Sulfurirhabdus autotrophica]
MAFPVAAKEWRVAPGESIANAIKSAASGDSIKVEHGYYHEQIIIDKPLSLIGMNRPTISGDNQPGDVIRIKSPDVSVKGFIVRDSGSDLTAQNAGIYVAPGSDRAVISGNDLIYTLFGLWIEKAKDVQIISNLITGKRDFMSSQRGNGIQLYNTIGAKIIGNNISFTRDGIYVDVSHHALFRDNKIHHLRYGTHYMNSYYNVWEGNESYLNRGGLALMEVRNLTVRNNRAWGNSDHGIMLRTIQDSVIEGNIVAGNARGFFIYDAEYNTIKNNLVVANRIGVHLWAGSKNNKVNGNDFIANQDQIKYVASNDQIWGEEQGNYWSNYVGWDRDGDGAGDVSYEANDIVDRMTWKHPMIKLLLNSPAVQTLRLVAQQFPLLRAPSIVDRHPHMRPYHENWSSWIEKQRH